MMGASVKTPLLALALASLVPSIVHAQPTPAGAPADPAEVAYQEGKRLYDIQEWDQAIAKFKEAYRMRSDAPSLFNIAQSYRLKGDCQNAISFYKTYRRNFPNAENGAKVDKFIADLETTCTKDAVVTPTTNPAVTTQVPEPTKVEPTKVEPTKVTPLTPPTNPVKQLPLPMPREEDPGHTKRLVGYALFGVGGVSLIGGIVFGVSAHGKSNDVTNGCGPWDPSLQTDGQHAQRDSRICFGLAGLTLIGGGIFYYLGHKQTEDARTPQLAIAPSDTGASVVWSGSF